MKRIPIVLMILFLACASARAADVDKVLSGLQSYWGNIDTFTAGFVQKKHLALLSGELTSRGTFAFRKPGDMVFRYDPPDDTIYGIKPGLITIYFPGLKKAKRIHLSPGSGTPQGMSFGMGPINDITALKKAFGVTADEKGGVTTLTLVPKGKDEAMKEIIISFKKDYTPLSTTIIERNGDSTVIEFSSQRANPTVNDAVFDVKIPAGVAVEEIGK